MNRDSDFGFNPEKIDPSPIFEYIIIGGNGYGFEIDEYDRVWIHGCDCVDEITNPEIAQKIVDELAKWIERKRS